MKLLLVSFFFLTIFVAGCGSRSKDAHDNHGKEGVKLKDDHAKEGHGKADAKKGDHAKDGHGDHGKGHSSGDALFVDTSPETVQAGKPAVLSLMIHDAAGKMLKDFDVVHEKKIHLIVVREGLDQFDHLHPDLDGSGKITIKHTFPVGGVYRLFVDYQPRGRTQTVATTMLKVAGTAPPAAPLVANVPGTVKADGVIAGIQVDGTKAGKDATIRFHLKDESGKPLTDLQPYLGEMGHVVVIRADAGEYVHVHPAHGKGAKDKHHGIVFEGMFSRPGLYKGWGQFQRMDRVITVPFVVNVE